MLSEQQSLHDLLNLKCNCVSPHWLLGNFLLFPSSYRSADISHNQLKNSQKYITRICSLEFTCRSTDHGCLVRRYMLPHFEQSSMFMKVLDNNTIVSDKHMSTSIYETTNICWTLGCLLKTSKQKRHKIGHQDPIQREKSTHILKCSQSHLLEVN